MKCTYVPKIKWLDICFYYVGVNKCAKAKSQLLDNCLVSINPNVINGPLIWLTTFVGIYHKIMLSLFKDVHIFCGSPLNVIFGHVYLLQLDNTTDWHNHA